MHSRPVGVITLNVAYQYLRGTRDYGSYFGPSRLYVDQRKARRTSYLAKRMSVEGFSEVGCYWRHWGVVWWERLLNGRLALGMWCFAGKLH